MTCAKTSELIEMPFGTWTWWAQGCMYGGAHCRHLTNKIELSMCGGNVALCQIVWLTAFSMCNARVWLLLCVMISLLQQKARPRSIRLSHSGFLLKTGSSPKNGTLSICANPAPLLCLCDLFDLFDLLHLWCFFSVFVCLRYWHDNYCTSCLSQQC